MNNKTKILTLIPALWTSIFDITITTIYQPVEYWQGNLDIANEGNPIGAFFMKNHVSGLFIISAIWIILIITLGYYLPKRISRIFLLFVLIAHSFGASTWVSNHWGFIYAMIFILINTILYLKIDEYERKTENILGTKPIKS